MFVVMNMYLGITRLHKYVHKLPRTQRSFKKGEKQVCNGKILNWTRFYFNINRKVASSRLVY